MAALKGSLYVLALLCLMMWKGLCQKPNLSGNKRRDVYIAGFFPYGRHIPESRVGRGVMPSVMLAVDHINENPSVLRNYMLHMYWNDTEVGCTFPYSNEFAARPYGHCHRD
jgi:gamma-aminobutyric acid type B receptor